MYNEELLLTNIFIVIYELNTETMKRKRIDTLNKLLQNSFFQN